MANISVVSVEDVIIHFILFSSFKIHVTHHHLDKLRWIIWEVSYHTELGAGEEWGSNIVREWSSAIFLILIIVVYRNLYPNNNLFMISSILLFLSFNISSNKTLIVPKNEIRRKKWYCSLNYREVVLHYSNTWED